YNAHQVNENDNRKNRAYPVMDGRVAKTYAADSRATNKNALSDPYVKAFRWAADRIGDEGVVAFVSNNGFLDGIAFDGMRAHLARDFDALYVLDLGGNVRRNPKLSGTTHNVFGIQVGVSIMLLIRRGQGERQGRVYYARTDETARREEKYAFLEAAGDWQGVAWREMQPDKRHSWLTEGMQSEFDTFAGLVSQGGKRGQDTNALFGLFSNGVQTNRDAWVYNFSSNKLTDNASRFIETYNTEIDRWNNRTNRRDSIDEFVTLDETKIKWSSRLKECFLRGQKATYSEEQIRYAQFRPYCAQYLYFNSILNHRQGQLPRIFPNRQSEVENAAIWVKASGTWPFFALAVKRIPDQMPEGGSQCFPFYTYTEDGTNRRENITDWALAQFRQTYGDETISKWDVFHYTYGLLHHLTYRQTYAANLRRELPRIPFVRDFWAFAEAGARLAELHVHYEQQPEHPLQRIENPDARLNWRVTRMKLSKDKTQLVYNDFLTLGGIPPAVYDYRLGNRSALEWVVDQYQVTTDKRSGITNDPNRADDPQYIVRLIGQVVAVSLETVAIVAGLPELEILAA
ncbi:MAG: type ISP restriction/modification enzyme, partial [Chromatiaceae bacterium]